MKKVATSFCLFFYCFTSFGQDEINKITDSITAEAKKLYKSEMASWNGTDIFLARCTNRGNIKGYLSYVHDDSATCIFFSNNEPTKVIGTISFDSTYNTNNAQVDISEREFTDKEKEYYTIRSKSLELVKSDTFFKRYSNTDFNLIPLIEGNERKVYVLTGPKEGNVVIFGNDYLIEFDNYNNVINMRRLHSNLMTAEYGGKTEGKEEVVGAIHTHAPTTGDFITSTDICTLMLYEKYAKWKSYIVVSEHYISIWNCEQNSLAVITREVWDKINEDQKKRHKNQ